MTNPINKVRNSPWCILSAMVSFGELLQLDLGQRCQTLCPFIIAWHPESGASDEAAYDRSLMRKREVTPLAQ